MRIVLLVVLIALGVLLAQEGPDVARGASFDDEHAPDLDASAPDTSSPPETASRAHGGGIAPDADHADKAKRPSVQREPSLRAVGDHEALLLVPGEPGLATVVAGFPWGETADLEREVDGDFAIRFTLPGDARRAGDRIDIAQHLEDGRVRTLRAYYVLDAKGSEPRALVVQHEDHGVLTINTGDRMPDLESVTVHGADGLPRYLAASGTTFEVRTATLEPRFAVLIRSRGGESTSFVCAMKGGVIRVVPQGRAATAVAAR